MGGEHEGITAGEWSRWQSSFQAFQTRLDDRLDQGFGGMNNRLDDINGRTRKNSEAIVVLSERVDTIRSGGCAQLVAHRATLDSLPPPDARPRTWRDWHPAVKVGAGAGGMAAFAGMLEIVRRLMEHFGI